MYILIIKDGDGIDYKEFRRLEKAQKELQDTFIEWCPEYNTWSLEDSLEYIKDEDKRTEVCQKIKNVEMFSVDERDKELYPKHAFFRKYDEFVYEATLLDTDEAIKEIGPKGCIACLNREGEDEMEVQNFHSVAEATSWLVENRAQDGNFLIFDLKDYQDDEQVIYWFDMDGVLAVWNTDASLEDTYKPGYFAERVPEKVAVETVKLLVKEGKDVRILSSTYQNGYAELDKKLWLYKVGLGDVPYVFVPYGEKKEKYIEKSGLAVLIDDFSQNLHSWAKAGARHLAIKFLNGINGTKGSWKSFTVSNKMTADEIYREIVGLAQMTLAANAA